MAARTERPRIDASLLLPAIRGALSATDPRTLATLAAILDPAVVVIGGGVSEAGPLLLDPINAHFDANLTARGSRPRLDIRVAELGNRAGLLGAADLARRS